MRASDRDRDRAIGRLRAAYGAGALSTDTFETRVAGAVAAREVGQLGSLVHDCPRERPAMDGVRRALRRVAEALRPEAELQAPPPASGTFAIGRSTECSRVFDDRTVSRVHAQLHWINGGWVLSDLGSLNGTWVNGWRIESAWVRDGDRVQLGALKLRFRAPR